MRPTLPPRLHHRAAWRAQAATASTACALLALFVAARMDVKAASPSEAARSASLPSLSGSMPSSRESPFGQAGLPAQQSPPRELSRIECLELALRQNRELQIERIQPRLADLAVQTALAAYDPILMADNRWEKLADTGGYDPADFSRDAIYEARSETSRSAVTGLLPGGMSYSLGADYAHSEGVRNTLGFESYSLRLGATLRQPLLRNFWIDRARLGIRTARLQSQAARQAVETRALSVAQRALHAFHELGFAAERLRTQSELTALRRDLITSTRQLVQGGLLTAPDESLARSRLAAAEAAETEARQALALSRHELLTLLGDPWTAETPSAVNPQGALDLPAVELDLMVHWEHAERHRPDLAQLRTALEQRQLDIRFWRNQLLPGLDLVGTYGRRGASTVQRFPNFPAFEADMDEAWDQVARGTAPNQGVGFVFTMPLSRRAERSQFRSSVEARAQMELLVRQREEWVRREVADAHAASLAARERIAQTREAREAADDALAAEQRRLQGGKSTLFVVLQLQSDLAAARVAEWRARADFLQGVNRLHAAEGTLLAHHGVVLLSTGPADGPTNALTPPSRDP